MEVLVISVLGFVGFAVLIGVLLVRQRKQLAARIASIEAKGWRYTAIKGTAYQIDGDSDGIPWIITVKTSSGGKNSGRKTTTVWEAPAEPIDQIVLFGPRIPPILASMNLGGSLVQMMLQFLLGDDAKDLANVQDVRGVGSDTFQAQFSVVATSKEAAEAVIVPDVEAPLIAAARRFGQPPVVLRWRDKIQVRLLQDAKTIDDLQALVDLGVEVAERSGHGTKA